jgi:hypothetical protein
MSSEYIPVALRQLVFERAAGICEYCRSQAKYAIDPLVIDHQDDLMAQVNNHDRAQVMHGLFPKRLTDTVLDAMTDHEKLSLEVLDNQETAHRFALLVLQMLIDANSPQRNNLQQS